MRVGENFWEGIKVEVKTKARKIIEARVNGSINYKDEKFNASITLGKIAGVEMWLDVNELRRALGK